MIVTDTSILVALILKNDQAHQRCVDVLDQVSIPLTITCYCLTEAMHLLGRAGGWPAQQQLWSFVEDQLVAVYPHQELSEQRLQILMKKYRDVPMDLADASLVALAEHLNSRKIFTLDNDFYIYRFQENQAFEVIP
jgi:predicted nucleic acid-binding protein